MKQSHWPGGMIACFAIFFANNLFAQTSFTEPQKGFTKNSFSSKVEDSLKQQFREKKLTWPPQAVYIRSFKYEPVQNPVRLILQ